jgi:hypothetical protein
MLNRRLFWLLILTASLAFAIFQGVQAAIGLMYFRAIPQENSILLEWETATEIDNAGFYISRNTEPNPPYTRISDFIPSLGEPAVGFKYQFLDENAADGTLYYYMLEVIDTSLNVEFYGPRSAIIGPPTNTPSPTATATNTSTPTATNTNTPDRSRTPTRTPRPTNTRRPTYTLIPSRTLTPAPPTFTPTFVTHTPTITLTPTITPSPTLIGPPDLVAGPPPTSTPIPAVATPVFFPSLTPTPVGFIAQIIESGYLVTLSAICLLILVWLAIAVGIFIYIQKRNG